MLQAPFPDANTDRRNAQCDSCGGRIGGPRLFCLDCDIKSSEFYNTLDLCSAAQCVGASVTREDLENAHEPDHRLVKVRTSLLTRSHGRVHTAACDAFGRVRETCRKIAESTSDSDEEAGPDVQKTSGSEPTSTEMSVKGDKPDDELDPPDGTKDGAEVGGKTSRDTGRGQVQDQSLPSCGKCNDSLSFPFWYCIFCEGQSPKDQASHPLLISRPIHQKTISSSVMHAIQKAYRNSCAAPVSIPRSTISFAAWRRRRMMTIPPLRTNGSSL
jgi:hypothetical protein